MKKLRSDENGQEKKHETVRENIQLFPHISKICFDKEDEMSMVR